MGYSIETAAGLLLRKLNPTGKKKITHRKELYKAMDVELGICLEKTQVNLLRRLCLAGYFATTENPNVFEIKG